MIFFSFRLGLVTDFYTNLTFSQLSAIGARRDVALGILENLAASCQVDIRLGDRLGMLKQFL